MEERALTDDWVTVFRQRNVWDLTPGDLQRWIERNQTFFAMLAELVPPGGRLLELGCGPGRHALAAATLGFRVQGIDIDPVVVGQATANAAAAAPHADVTFAVGDMGQLADLFVADSFSAITHGGLMEHFESAAAIHSSLAMQLRVAPYVVFDVPIHTEKNVALFARDDIFRQVWTAEQWVEDVLAGLPVARWQTERHPADWMTDDLVVVLDRSGGPIEP